ncbi:MAG: cysteine hydrolase family protein [Dethiobacteria bacterium]|jgi:ureidoacrylate peracid hydrolase
MKKRNLFIIATCVLLLLALTVQPLLAADAGKGSVTLSAAPEKIEIDPLRTAVLVIDMQNAFCSKGGMFDVAGMFEEEKVEGVIKANKKVIDAAREAGSKVIYLRMGFREDYSDAGGVNSPNPLKEVGLVLNEFQPRLERQIRDPGHMGLGDCRCA